ncbi:TetR/AcrR family transcriptional regulator [Tomitella cavernea]|uniref:HTH tetR-type domain-containing protein n=1 Tax=Tomitella cavernea TaxID=1387982 RepID=A0ABP9CSN8_9ACTN|nr:TetR/AcrR family transcriptional regulator [Tomitella cavernea]
MNVRGGPVPRSCLPVRVPRQESAKRTVASILDATADLLVEGGVDAVNINAVAEAAGTPEPVSFSVGSCEALRQLSGFKGA